MLARKWREISVNLADRLKKRKYTPKACKERHEALKLGKALKPIEIDSDQEGRRQMREERIAANKALRAEQAAEAQRIEDEKKRKAEERKQERDVRQRERILQDREKKNAKAHQLKMKEDKKKEKQEERTTKKKAIERAKAQDEWQKQLRKAEAELYEKLTGSRLKARGAPLPANTKFGRGKPTSRDDLSTDESDAEDDGTIADDDRDEEISVDGSSVAHVASSKGISSGKAPTQPSPAITVAVKVPVTKETLVNARSIMTMAELDVLLFQRKLPKRLPDESHPEVVARLAKADQALSTQEISELLSSYLVKGKGNKKARILRLQDHDAENSEAGQEGVSVDDPEFIQSYEGYKGEYSSLIAG